MCRPVLRLYLETIVFLHSIITKLALICPHNALATEVKHWGLAGYSNPALC